MLLKQEQTEGTENRLKLREERLRLNGRRLDRCLAISFSIIRCDLGDLCDRSVRSETFRRDLTWENLLARLSFRILFFLAQRAQRSQRSQRNIRRRLVVQLAVDDSFKF